MRGLYQQVVEDVLGTVEPRIEALEKRGPAVDGRVTLEDVATAVAMMFGFVSIGVIIGLAVWVITQDTRAMTTTVAIVTGIGAVLAALRLALDAFNPAMLLQEFKEFREFRDKFQEFQEWRLEQQYGHPKVVTHEASILLREPDTTRMEILGLTGEDLVRAVQFARAYNYLVVNGVDNPTAEVHWIGSGQVWSGSQRTEWDAFKQALIKHKLAKVVDRRGKWELNQDGLEFLREISQWDIG